MGGGLRVGLDRCLSDVGEGAVMRCDSIEKTTLIVDFVRSEIASIVVYFFSIRIDLK